MTIQELLYLGEILGQLKEELCADPLCLTLDLAVAIVDRDMERRGLADLPIDQILAIKRILFPLQTLIPSEIRRVGDGK